MSPLLHLGPWWPVYVEFGDPAVPAINDAIRGRDRAEAAENAAWNWPDATHIEVAAEPEPEEVTDL